MLHRLKVREVHINIDSARLGLFLGQTDSADVGLAKHRGWNKRIVHHLLSVSELGLRKGHCLLNGNGCQLWSACHIAECKDRWLVGLEAFIGTDIAAVIKFHRGFFQAQAFDIRVATGGAEYSINHDM